MSGKSKEIRDALVEADSPLTRHSMNQKIMKRTWQGEGRLRRLGEELGGFRERKKALRALRTDLRRRGVAHFYPYMDRFGIPFDVLERNADIYPPLDELPD